MERLRAMIFKNGEESFLAELDAAGVSYSLIFQLSEGPKNSGKPFELLSAVSEAMPWNSLAKVVVAWIKAQNSREVIITTKEGGTFHVKGYAASEVQKLLYEASKVIVIDTKKEDE